MHDEATGDNVHVHDCKTGEEAGPTISREEVSTLTLRDVARLPRSLKREELCNVVHNDRRFKRLPRWAARSWVVHIDYSGH